MASLPNPIGNFGVGLYQGYQQRRDRIDELNRQEAQQQFANQMATRNMDLQLAEQQRIREYQQWQMQNAERNAKSQIEQQYMKAITADLTGMDEQRKQLFHTYVNTLEEQLGIKPTAYRQGMYDKARSLDSQQDALKTFMPDNSTLRPELLGALAPDLMGKLPQTGGQTVPQEAVGEMTSAGFATGQPAQGQPQSPYVQVQQGLDAKTAANTMRSDYISLKEAVERNANPAEIRSIVAMIAMKHKTLTGRELTEDELKFNMDNMTAYQSGKLEQGDRGLDIREDALAETGRHNKAMEENARISANASMKRAETAVKNWQANRDQATGNAVVEEYGRLSNERVQLLKAGFTTDSAEVKRIDAKLKAIEPAYNNAFRFTNGGGGDGGIDPGTKLTTAFSPDTQSAIARALRQMKAAGQFPTKGAAINSLKKGHPGWNANEIGKIWDYVNQKG